MTWIAITLGVLVVLLVALVATQRLTIRSLEYELDHAQARRVTVYDAEVDA